MLHICKKSANFAAKFIFFMLFQSQIIDLLEWIPWARVRRQKKALRGIVEQRRRIMSKEEVTEQSAQIIANLEQMSHFQKAQVVLVYYPIHNEVNLMPLVEKYKDEKTFLFPATHRDYMEVRPFEGTEKMKRGKFHVPEPQTAMWTGDIDLIIAPGVAFDHKCMRIGRGGGFYDKFLKNHPDVFQIGVCYDFQLRKRNIPKNWWDRGVNRVVTPIQTIGS